MKGRDNYDEDMPFGGHVGYLHTSQSKFISSQCMCDECEEKKINGWQGRTPVRELIKRRLEHENKSIQSV